MKPRDIAVSFVIPDCTLPVGILRSRKWYIMDDTSHGVGIVIGIVDLDERPKVNPIQKRSRKARKRKP